MIAARLAARGRESVAEIEARLARQAEDPSGPDVCVIDNSDAPDIACRRFVDLLTGDMAPA